MVAVLGPFEALPYYIHTYTYIIGQLSQVILSIFSFIPEERAGTSHKSAIDIISANGYVYRVFLHHNRICNTSNEDMVSMLSPSRFMPSA
jgi:hypothetical protein